MRPTLMMSRRTRYGLGLVVAGLTLFACGGAVDSPGEPTPEPSPTVSPEPMAIHSGLYEASGLVVDVDTCGEFGSWNDGDRFAVDVDGDVVMIANVYAMQKTGETTYDGVIEETLTPTPGCTIRSERISSATVEGTDELTWSPQFERELLDGNCAFASSAALTTTLTRL